MRKYLASRALKLSIYMALLALSPMAFASRVFSLSELVTNVPTSDALTELLTGSGTTITGITNDATTFAISGGYSSDSSMLYSPQGHHYFGVANGQGVVNSISMSDDGLTIVGLERGNIPGVPQGAQPRTAFYGGIGGVADTLPNGILVDHVGPVSGNGNHVTIQFQSAPDLFSGFGDVGAPGTGGSYLWNLGDDFTQIADYNQIQDSTIFTHVANDGETYAGHIRPRQEVRFELLDDGSEWWFPDASPSDYHAIRGGQTISGFAGGVGSIVTGMSNNGQVIAGNTQLQGGEHPFYEAVPGQPFRWTASGGLEFLGGVGDQVTQVSGNGRVIAGHTASNEAFIWTETTGYQGLQQYALGRGFEGIADWEFQRITSVSENGFVISGTGVRNGTQEAFVLDTTPTVNLAWTDSAPNSYEPVIFLNPFGFKVLQDYIYHPDKPSSPLVHGSSEAYQALVSGYLRQILNDSGLSDIRITENPSEHSSSDIDVYFTEAVDAEDVINPGRRVQYGIAGLDQYNERESGSALILAVGLTEHDDVNNAAFFDAHIAAHEIGHEWGLQHVEPSGQSGTLMDYCFAEIPTLEVYYSGVAEILNNPSMCGEYDGSGPETHNPRYHLYRYVLGWTEEELQEEFGDASGIGTYDLRSDPLVLEETRAGTSAENLIARLTIGTVTEYGSGVTLLETRLAAVRDVEEITDKSIEWENVQIDALNGMALTVDSRDDVYFLGKTGDYEDATIYDVSILYDEGIDEFNVSGVGEYSGTLVQVSDSGYQELGRVTISIALSVSGDLNLDGFVGVEDLDIILANWGDTVMPGQITLGDATGDGLVSQADLQVVLDNWGDGTPPDINVPEPSTLAMCGMMCSLLCQRRKRR